MLNFTSVLDPDLNRLVEKQCPLSTLGSPQSKQQRSITCLTDLDLVALLLLN